MVDAAAVKVRPSPDLPRLMRFDYGALLIVGELLQGSLA